jgi:hypothetical protein
VSAVRHQRITSVLLAPLPRIAKEALLWRDVAGRQLRRGWMAHWRQQTVTIALLPAGVFLPARPSGS